MKEHKQNNQIAEYITAAIQGDNEAFYQLYCLFEEQLFRFLLTRTTTRDDALDLLQDISVAVWKALPSFTYYSEPQFFGFVFRIARRALARYYNKRRVQVPYSDEQLQQMYEMPVGDARLITDVVAGLSKKYQEVIHLRYWGQLTFAEIAATCNISESAAKVRHHRAIRSLAASFQRYETD